MSGRVSLAVLTRRLTTAGVQPGDSDELQLKKQVLLFACGLMIAGSAVWLSIYRLLGVSLPATLPVAFQLLALAALLAYLWTLNFEVFRATQLGLWLFVPFVAEWAIGDFVSASGVILWGLLAPVGAALLYSARESLPWMVAYVVLTLASGYVDFNLIGLPHTSIAVPLKTSAVFFALNFAAVATIVYWLLNFAFTERARSRSRLEVAHTKLQEEQNRSQRLLLNILPGPIAERLKLSNSQIADGYSEVTVMFADIVNFTHIAENMTPAEVFSLLNRMFSEFDTIAERHGLEKIKTIGDAYMVAGGLNASAADFSGSIAELALDMRNVVESRFAVDDKPLQLRIGIGTGPVVAGVVGRKKFIYDLWGDTVNIASRITSEGVPGAIHADESTYLRLQDRYAFDPPQSIYLKGKGDTRVYRLTGRNAAA